MEKSKFEVSIYTIEVTVYKTGNLHISYTNNVTGEQRIVKVHNPFVHKQLKDNYSV